MLEKTSLLLRPWNAVPSGVAEGRVRTVVDLDDAILGIVREPPPRTPRWLRWLSKRSLEVFEMPDNSLVFALRRGWSWPSAWHLVDADDRLVGKLRGRALLDGLGQFLALVEPPDDLGRGRFLALDGRELGDYTRETAGTRVKFSAELEGNPFARMMLLGAVLVREV